MPEFNVEAENVLCAVSAYDEKYYLNPVFSRLPDSIKEELKTICILFVEDVGGIFLMEFNEDGELMLRTMARDSDYLYDEIGAGMLVGEIQKQRSGLMRELELYYQAVILGKPLDEIE